MKFQSIIKNLSLVTDVDAHCDIPSEIYPPFLVTEGGSSLIICNMDLVISLVSENKSDKVLGNIRIKMLKSPK